MRCLLSRPSRAPYSRQHPRRLTPPTTHRLAHLWRSRWAKRKATHLPHRRRVSRRNARRRRRPPNQPLNHHLGLSACSRRPSSHALFLPPSCDILLRGRSEPAANPPRPFIPPSLSFPQTHPTPCTPGASVLPRQRVWSFALTRSAIPLAGYSSPFSIFQGRLPIPHSFQRRPLQRSSLLVKLRSAFFHALDLHISLSLPATASPLNSTQHPQKTRLHFGRINRSTQD